MSIVQGYGAHAAPHIVVVGNHKGGSGKSTVAMHIIVALLKAGKRVASFDLDVNQQTLTHYIENRREWARRNNLALELPNHCPIAQDQVDATERSDAADFAKFTSHLEALRYLETLREHEHDFIVIDTPGGTQRLSLVAHGMADTLVTPINDSLVDLDVIVAVGPSRELEPQPSQYAKTVTRALEGRRSVCGQTTDWIVVRNRLGAVASRNQRQVTDLLESAGSRLGFRAVRGLSERLVFREFFAMGLTAFDPIESSVLGTRPSSSHLVARLEIRDLVEQIGLLTKQSTQDEIPAPAKRTLEAAGTEVRVEAPRRRRHRRESTSGHAQGRPEKRGKARVAGS